MLKKILLAIMPPFWPKIPPAGIGYLQAFLDKKGIETDILDVNNIFYNLVPADIRSSWLLSCNRYLEDNILSIIDDKFPEKLNSVIGKILNYEIVGFSCFKSNLKTTLETIRILKARKSDMKIILGGPEITRQYFKNKGGFDDDIKGLSDLIVIGEGEKALFDYIKEGNKTVKTSAFMELKDLDDLPFPKYKGVELDTYPRKDTISLLSSRGCIKRCNFCSERLLYKKFRIRPANNVIEEIGYHRSKNKIRYFVFNDSMINGDLKSLEELCDGIIENFGSIAWEAQLYIREDMGLDLLNKMKKSGCYNLFIGLESGSDTVLAKMNKGSTTEKAVSFFKKLKGSGLSFGVSIIVGYPGETDKEFREGLDFLIRHKEIVPKIEQVNPFTYYDGTDIPKEADYTLNNTSLERLEIFTREIKKHGFKYTSAFIGNLIEKDATV